MLVICNKKPVQLYSMRHDCSTIKNRYKLIIMSLKFMLQITNISGLSVVLNIDSHYVVFYQPVYIVDFRT